MLRVVSETTEPSNQQDSISASDLRYMQLAVEHAQRGLGHTFPNPAVGCVLVRDSGDNGNGNNGDDKTIIGQGFHPRAGYPHAEVFALLEAAGHVENGVQAAQAVVDVNQIPLGNPLVKQKQQKQQLVDRINGFLDQYANDPQGPERLFTNACQCNGKHTMEDPPPQSEVAAAATAPPWTESNAKVTAYVTLEPCCHYGRTPPCAAALNLAKVHRVVVGFRDPNPRVDGGGVQFLQQAGVQVDLLPPPLSSSPSSPSGTMASSDSASTTEAVAAMCHDLVRNFVKRIAPDKNKNTNNNTMRRQDYDSYMTGNHRMALRSRANRMKAAGTLPVSTWDGPPLYKLLSMVLADDKDKDGGEDTKNDNEAKIKVCDDDDDDEQEQDSMLSLLLDEQQKPKLVQALLQQSLSFIPGWMEQLDALLWDHELVGVRLNKAVPKKRITKLLGNCVADMLQAHVAQSQGHTVLLYRPGAPPVMDLDQLVVEYKSKSKDKKKNQQQAPPPEEDDT
ncbi:hypothetical protein ACA910_014066 [Epithemia clementina (nom. ined.)]